MLDPSVVRLGLFAQAGGGGSNAALLTFAIYTVAVLGVAWFANRLLRSRNFLSEYFLGSRNLGVWAFALTFAATSSSGGSFTGFPSLIYTHGWVLALWIGSYMVVPVCTMGLLGKRLNQVARKTGAITVPDVIRDRFDSAALGIVATLLIIFFMSFNLVAQFKAGSLILQTLLSDVPLFQSATTWTAGSMPQSGWLAEIEPGYFVCLLAFALAVIFYTAYGGFHAVVWTDVLQGVVMVVGVLVMLPLAINQVGGLETATARMARMTPPRPAIARLELDGVAESDLSIPIGTWLTLPSEENSRPRLFRTGKERVIKAGERTVENVPVIEITTPEDVNQILASFANGSAEPMERVQLTVTQWKPYRYGAERQGVYVTGPGPGVGENELNGFLPLSVAVSFFFMWAISGTGQPSSMIRLMAFRNALTLSRAIFTVSIYYTLIYFPLVVIFCCARVLLPGMEQESDRIMPAMAVHLTAAAGWPWLAGLLVAAPFAAIMSTVDSFLLMIASALVRDLYQRNLNPDASERTIRRLSYACTLLVGVAAVVGALNPPEYLQNIIVYAGSGLAASFLIPMAAALYWPRVNTAGAMTGMLGGFAMHLALYVAGRFRYEELRPLRPLGFDPIIWGLATSLVLLVVVTCLSPPPPERLVRRYFFRAGAE